MGELLKSNQNVDYLLLRKTTTNQIYRLCLKCKKNIKEFSQDRINYL